MKIEALRNPRLLQVCCLGVSLLILGCNSNQSKPDEVAPAPTPQASASPAPAKVSAPCPPAKEKPKTTKKSKAADAKNKVPESDKDCAPAVDAKEPGDGPDLSRNKPVTDSSSAKSGEGVRVKGLDGWEGEISGVPAPGTKFTRLKIGMPLKQVKDLIGLPTDEGVYVTGKAFIPFYFGSDKNRWEMAYKGQGRLVFANQAGLGSGYYLIWVIHSRNDNGYR